MVYNCSFSQRNCAPFNFDENWSDKDVDLFRRCFFRRADEAVPPLLVMPWLCSVPWWCFLLLEREEDVGSLFLVDDCLLCCCLFLLLLFLFFLVFLLLFLGFFGNANMVSALGEEARSGEVVESGGYSIKEKQNKRMRERERGEVTQPLNYLFSSPVWKYTWTLY